MPGQHRRVSYAKAVYFWRLNDTADSRNCIAEDAFLRVRDFFERHHLLRDIFYATLLYVRCCTRSFVLFFLLVSYFLRPVLRLRHSDTPGKSSKSDFSAMTPDDLPGAAPYFFTFHMSHLLWEVRKHGTVARCYQDGPLELRFAFGRRRKRSCLGHTVHLGTGVLATTLSLTSQLHNPSRFPRTIPKNTLRKKSIQRVEARCVTHVPEAP